MLARKWSHKKLEAEHKSFSVAVDKSTQNILSVLFAYSFLRKKIILCWRYRKSSVDFSLLFLQLENYSSSTLEAKICNRLKTRCIYHKNVLQDQFFVM